MQFKLEKMTKWKGSSPRRSLGDFAIDKGLRKPDLEKLLKKYNNFDNIYCKRLADLMINLN